MHILLFMLNAIKWKCYNNITNLFKLPFIATDSIVLRNHAQDPFHDLLLIQRKNHPFQNKLAFPGGFIEMGETAEHACLRELNEETCLSGTQLSLVTVASNPLRDPRKHVISIVYHVHVEDFSPLKGMDDAKNAKFYDMKSILKNKDCLAFDHYAILEKFLKNVFPCYKDYLNGSKFMKVGEKEMWFDVMDDIV